MKREAYSALTSTHSNSGEALYSLFEQDISRWANNFHRPFFAIEVGDLQTAAWIGVRKAAEKYVHLTWTSPHFMALASTSAWNSMHDENAKWGHEAIASKRLGSKVSADEGTDWEKGREIVRLHQLDLLSREPVSAQATTLLQLLKPLPRAQREAIFHRFIQDLSYAEAALELKSTTANVRRNVNRGLKRLQTIYNKTNK